MYTEGLQYFRIMSSGMLKQKDIRHGLLRKLTSRQSKTWRALNKYLYCSSGLQSCSSLWKIGEGKGTVSDPDKPQSSVL